MSTKSDGTGTPFHSMTRREFIRLAAIAGVLAGCGPVVQSATPTTVPPSPAPKPTDTPNAPPSPAPKPTDAPKAMPTNTVALQPSPGPSVVSSSGRPEIIKTYPAVPSRVVRTHHAGVWSGDKLVPGAIRQMLDASITKLTGLSDAPTAWAALFKPTEKIAIKVNVFRNSLIWTHLPLVMAVTDSLKQVGIPPERIVVFDYYTDELKTANYPVNEKGPGVRCYGTDFDQGDSIKGYTEGWKAGTKSVELSNILLGCDALINMPILKSHMITGLTFALKNHFGSVSSPASLHYPYDQSLAGLNALPPIKDRTRLIVGDILTANLHYRSGFPYWDSDWTGDSILMSFDPVAHDTVGLQILTDLVKDNSSYMDAITAMAAPYLKSSAEIGLGTNDPKHMELMEVKLT